MWHGDEELTYVNGNEIVFVGRSPEAPTTPTKPKGSIGSGSGDGSSSARSSRKLPGSAQAPVLVRALRTLRRERTDTDVVPPLYYFELFVKMSGGGLQATGSLGVGLAKPAAKDGAGVTVSAEADSADTSGGGSSTSSTISFLHYHNSGRILDTFPRPVPVRAVSGRPYGPPFASGDTVGCGWLASGEVFFTLNGRHLGVAYSDVWGRLCPAVDFDFPGAQLILSFGGEGELQLRYTGDGKPHDSERWLNRVDRVSRGLSDPRASVRGLVDAAIQTSVGAAAISALRDGKTALQEKRDHLLAVASPDRWEAQHAAAAASPAAAAAAPAVALGIGSGPLLVGISKVASPAAAAAVAAARAAAVAQLSGCSSCSTATDDATAEAMNAEMSAPSAASEASIDIGSPLRSPPATPAAPLAVTAIAAAIVTPITAPIAGVPTAAANGAALATPPPPPPPAPSSTTTPNSSSSSLAGSLGSLCLGAVGAASSASASLGLAGLPAQGLHAHLAGLQAQGLQAQRSFLRALESGLSVYEESSFAGAAAAGLLPAEALCVPLSGGASAERPALLRAPTPPGYGGTQLTFDLAHAQGTIELLEALLLRTSTALALHLSGRQPKSPEARSTLDEPLAKHQPSAERSRGGPVSKLLPAHPAPAGARAAPPPVQAVASERQAVARRPIGSGCRASRSCDSLPREPAPGGATMTAGASSSSSSSSAGASAAAILGDGPVRAEPMGTGKSIGARTHRDGTLPSSVCRSESLGGRPITSPPSAALDALVSSLTPTVVQQVSGALVGTAGAALWAHCGGGGASEPRSHRSQNSEGGKQKGHRRQGSDGHMSGQPGLLFAKEGLKEGLKELKELAKEGLKEGLKELKDGFKEHKEGLKEELKELKELAREGLKEGLKELKDGFKEHKDGLTREAMRRLPLLRMASSESTLSRASREEMQLVEEIAAECKLLGAQLRRAIDAWLQPAVMAATGAGSTGAGSTEPPAQTAAMIAAPLAPTGGAAAPADVEYDDDWGTVLPRRAASYERERRESAGHLQSVHLQSVHLQSVLLSSLLASPLPIGEERAGRSAPPTVSKGGLQDADAPLTRSMPLPVSVSVEASPLMVPQQEPASGGPLTEPTLLSMPPQMPLEMPSGAEMPPQRPLERNPEDFERLTAALALADRARALEEEQRAALDRLIQLYDRCRHACERQQERLRLLHLLRYRDRAVRDNETARADLADVIALVARERADTPEALQMS
jgi:hypothetical protein